MNKESIEEGKEKDEKERMEERKAKVKRRG